MLIYRNRASSLREISLGSMSFQTAGDVVIVGAVRTPIGRYGGAFRNVHPAELAAAATRAALERSRVSPELVDEVLMGHGRQAGSGPNTARQVVKRAGLPDDVPAYTINKACASSLQAVASGAQSIVTGESEVVVTGGMESMSRMPYLVDAEDARWGHRMGNFALVDAMYRDGFTCSLCGLVMGETAEVLARQYRITRESSDAYAVESQRRAASAQAARRFEAEIVPIEVTDAKDKTTTVSVDEHLRPDTTIEILRKLPTVFGEVEGHPGIITAGTSSGITDGAAAVVLMSEKKAGAEGIRPRARILGWASAAVDPRIMGIGPVPAVRKLLERLRLTLDDFDLVELNEAFAPQVLAVLRDLPIPSEKLNVNGGAIALGHPIGATGARLLVTLLHEMEKRDVRLGLATLCVSGGLGMAMVIERN
jgi:acetyl-CoA C-acetyltransferase